MRFTSCMICNDLVEAVYLTDGSCLSCRESLPQSGVFTFIEEDIWSESKLLEENIIRNSAEFSHFKTDVNQW